MTSSDATPPTVQFIPIDQDGGYQNAIDILRFADYEDGEQPRTLLEMELIDLAGAIRDRESWWTKILDDRIVGAWRGEAFKDGGNSSVNDAKFKYALAECRWYAKAYPGPARPAGADGVFSRDGICSDLLRRLLDGIQKIKDDGPRDVHPGSDGLVVDIVHPSLYAYEQGVTPVSGGADVYEMPPWSDFLLDKTADPEEPFVKNTADRYQQVMCSKAGLAWLPAEFFVPPGGSECRINSYINSLHPKKHADMYAPISEAFLVCLPLLEGVLSELGTVSNPRERPLRVLDVLQRVSEKSLSSNEDDDDDYDSYWNRRPIVMPKVPEEFVPPPTYPKVSLIDKRLQVIVKVASIELTPSQPAYPGGTWHVEGMRNERIVATACMYLESENCTESSLEFRVAVGEPEYEQNDNVGVETIFGLRDEEPLVQPRGACRTLAGRVLAWPNTMQHRVRPFELADKALPGRRTILCFFLVDPMLRIRSTATVPPQCRAWLDEEFEKSLSKRFPSEVSAHISKHLYGMSYEDACERRNRLMEERKKEVTLDTNYEIDNSIFFERPFSLCEH